jgi:UDPglucose--hexose-1-phosphate uridylyltransferase
VGIVDWYNSVIRLQSDDRKAIRDFVVDIINAWENYTDEKCDVYAFTGETPHNSLSPVCRKQKDGSYIIDMILRNNRTNDEFPEGIFHAHPEYHNIKKEGIGLIEAMGLFILPGRLKKQLNMIAEILCQKTPYDKQALADKDNYLFAHKDMIASLVDDGFAPDMEQAEQRVTEYVNKVCKNILFNTAVFKNDQNGQDGFDRFLYTCGVE